MVKKIILAVVAAVLVIGGIAGFNIYTSHQEKTILVGRLENTLILEPVTVNQTVADTGTVTVMDTSAVYIKTSQTVATVPVKEGDYIKKGDVLATYDIEDERAEFGRKIAEAELNLSNARLNAQNTALPASGNELLQYESDIVTSNKNLTDAQSAIDSVDIKIAQQQILLDSVKDNLDKNKVLYDQGLLAESMYKDIKTNYDNALEAMNDLQLQKKSGEATLTTREAQLSQAQQRLNNAQSAFSNSSTSIQYALNQNSIELHKIELERLNSDLEKLTETTLAPCNGNIKKLNVTEGGKAGTANPIAEISRLESVVVKADFSEFSAPALTVGQKVEITTGALKDMVYHGEILKIAGEAKKKENSSDDETIVPVEIKVSDMDERLKIGYTVDVQVFIDKAENVIAVPPRAILYEDNSQYVFVVNADESGFIKQEVRLGLTGDSLIEIISGLNIGDRIRLDTN